MSLHASELNPVIATLRPRTLVLKFAIVRELKSFLIFFRFVPDVQPYGNYSEMYKYNALKNNDPSFCRDLNVSTTSHQIYDNNEAALNSSGYFFWAYKITTSTKPTYQILLTLGNDLCQTLNGIRHNISTVRIEKDNLFWLTESTCVWANIVGDNKAMEYLLEKIGNITPNMYNQNKDLIHSHFRPNSFPSELNQILRMPMQASDTMFHTTTKQHSTVDKQHVTILTDS